MEHDVFISYAKGDQATAQALAEALKAKGVSAWTAFKELKPGDLWASKIPDAIEKSRVFILIFSAAANASAHTVREVQLAFERRETLLASGREDILFIPFFIEDVTPTGAMRYLMGNLQRFEASPPKGEHYATLAEMVAQSLTKPAPAPSKNGRARTASKKAATKKKPVTVSSVTAATMAAAVRGALRAAAKEEPPSGIASATPETLLDHAPAAFREWSGQRGGRRRAEENGALKFFLSFLGLRHGSTTQTVIAVLGTPDKDHYVAGNHLAMCYPAKGLTVYCDRHSRKVKLVAAEARAAAAWVNWKKTQGDLKYLGKQRKYIIGKFGQPNSRLELSRLNPDILDYDFAGSGNRSGYVVFDCPARKGEKCTSMQIHWFY